MLSTRRPPLSFTSNCMGVRSSSRLSTERSQSNAFAREPNTLSAKSTMRAMRRALSVSTLESLSLRDLRCFSVLGEITISEISVNVSPCSLRDSIAVKGRPFSGNKASSRSEAARRPTRERTWELVANGDLRGHYATTQSGILSMIARILPPSTPSLPACGNLRNTGGKPQTSASLSQPATNSGAPPSRRLCFCRQGGKAQT